MKLKLNNVKQIDSNNTPTNTNSSSNIKLTLTPNKQYDLDEIIAAKRRDNYNESILMKVNINDDNVISVVNYVAKLVLEQNDIPFTDDNFKTQVQLIPDFEYQFESTLTKYYPIYEQNINNLENGRISINSVLEKISFAYTDYTAYLASTDAKIDVTGYYDGTDNKAHVNIIEGTQEDTSVQETVVHTTNLELLHMYGMYNSNLDALSENTAVVFTNTVLSTNGTKYAPGMYIYRKINSHDVRKKLSYNSTELSNTIEIPDSFVGRSYLGILAHIAGNIASINIPNNIEIEEEETLYLIVREDDNIIGSREIRFHNGIIDTYISLIPDIQNNILFKQGIKINLESTEGYLIGTIGFEDFSLLDLSAASIADVYDDNNNATIFNDYINNEGYCFDLMIPLN